MAITLTYNDIKKKAKVSGWKNIYEFEIFYIRYLNETLADRLYYTNKEGIEVTFDSIDHHPVLHEYEVWMAGYVVQGGSAGPELLGKAKARNFAQACDIIMCKKHLEYIEKINRPEYREYTGRHKWDYNPHELSNWACKLYWSEDLVK